jgi:tetratricopeptide (TPR) repeat protein
MKRLLLAVFGLLPAACQSLPPADESFARGNVLLDAGDAPGAIGAYTAALQQNDRHALAYNNRGLARAALKDYEGALSDYTACLALPDPFAEAHYNRGIALLRLGRKGEAIVDFTDALKLNPQYARAHAGRGLAFAAGGDKASALADYRKALDVAPPDWSDRKAVEAEIAKLSEPKK